MRYKLYDIIAVDSIRCFGGFALSFSLTLIMLSLYLKVMDYMVAYFFVLQNLLKIYSADLLSS